MTTRSSEVLRGPSDAAAFDRAFASPGSRLNVAATNLAPSRGRTQQVTGEI